MRGPRPGPLRPHNVALLCGRRRSRGASRREGLVWAFTRYGDDYAALEEEARAERRGVWQAATQASWDYRANRWDAAETAAPRAGCPIKGNIDDEGERIHHAPWSPWYARTTIDEARGERWFCDEAEAVEAGWRAARSR